MATAPPITTQQRHLVRAHKQLVADPAAGPLVVLNETGDLLGSLTAIGPRESQQADVCESLARWRQMFRDFFLTQFTPTAQRTQRWLTNVVLPDDTRILFLIRDATGRPVGNFGVCGIGEHCAELDNLIRGERGGDARLVFYAEVRLLAWCFTELDVTTICLHVFHTNTRTIGLHATVGFRVAGRNPLWQVKQTGEVRLSTEPLPESTATEIELVRMEMTRSEFLAIHGWAVPSRKETAWTR